MQYSVFICDLDQMELIALRTDLASCIHHSQDSIAIIHLGDPAERGRDCFMFMGVSSPLPTSGSVVI